MERPIHTKIHIQASMLTLNNTKKNYRYRSTGSGTSHVNKIGKLGLEHMERPIHSKFDIYACLLTLKNTKKIIVIGPQSTVPPI